MTEECKWLTVSEGSQLVATPTARASTGVALGRTLIMGSLSLLHRTRLVVSSTSLLSLSYTEADADRPLYSTPVPG
jgi:hypothetical protein